MDFCPVPAISVPSRATVPIPGRVLNSPSAASRRRIQLDDPAVQEWEQALHELPGAFGAGSGTQLRERLRRLPPFPTDRLLPPWTSPGRIPSLQPPLACIGGGGTGGSRSGGGGGSGGGGMTGDVEVSGRVAVWGRLCAEVGAALCTSATLSLIQFLMFNFCSHARRHRDPTFPDIPAQTQTHPSRSPSPSPPPPPGPNPIPLRTASCCRRKTLLTTPRLVRWNQKPLPVAASWTMVTPGAPTLCFLSWHT